MDLYETARHVSHPFVFDEATDPSRLPIGAHGLIGDGNTAALVRVDGAIDWLCMPRFDSPALFAALLDPERGGITNVTPVRRPFEAMQAYDAETNVLETLFRVPGAGVVRLTDFMPWGDDPRASIHEVHRRIEGIEGDVEMAVGFDPRFGYGAEPATIEFGEHGVLALGPGGEHLVAVAEGAAPWRARGAGGVETRVSVRAGQRRWMVLSWDAPAPEPLASYRPFDLLRATRVRWRTWAARLEYDGPWRHHVLRSALCLKLLTYAPTGALVAAPTTSLPEWIGGARNWDYRYAWVRDAALAVRANNLIGFGAEARDFFHFVRDTIDPVQGLAVLYAVDGRAVPEERILAGLRGYRGSAPVRVGNGARDQLQLDSAGALIDAAQLYEHFGGTLTVRAWRKLRRVLEDVERRWHEPDHGIWEPRHGMRHNVHSRLMSWLALDRGAGIARGFGDRARHERWLRVAGDVHADVCARGLSADGRHFVATFGEERADAALLLLIKHGFLPEDHPLMFATSEFVRRELGVGSFLRRYRDDDGVGGDEGAFLLCGFWMAEVLALQGRLDEGLEVFRDHLHVGNHLGLLAEEVDPGTGELLGNFPQAFSHLGLINAAVRLDLALRLRDEGSHRVPHVVGARPRIVS